MSVQSVTPQENCSTATVLSHRTASEKPSNSIAAARKLSFRNKLTPSQIAVIELLANGLRNKEIAKALHVKERTIKAHLNHVFMKLNVCGFTDNYRPRLELARNWHCELYQEGLKALGYL